MSKILPFLSFCFLAFPLFSQDYDHWIVGDTSDVETTAHQAGLVLAGGATDNDQAMQWMLERAGGGDVLVIRASGSDGYNDYFFSELGVEVNSVETIRFNNLNASADPYVLRRIEEAEILFMAGGNQTDYYDFWKDTQVEDLINWLHNEKGITIGGTSAGMAILGHYYYTPTSEGVVSEEALFDPFHPNMDILGSNDFLDLPYLERLITDTHFDQRSRAGRLVTFMARLTEENGERAFGIASNEYTAVVITPDGIASAFGEYPQFEEDMVYFLQANCMSPFEPETITPGVPLTWNQNEQAVKVYRVPATLDASNQFDLNDWKSGVGGFWEDWYVEEGDLFRNVDAQPNECALISGIQTLNSRSNYQLSQNPVQDFLRIIPTDYSQNPTLEIFDLAGALRQSGQGYELNISTLAAGTYILRVSDELGVWSFKIFRAE